MKRGGWDIDGFNPAGKYDENEIETRRQPKKFASFGDDNSSEELNELRNQKNFDSK